MKKTAIETIQTDQKKIISNSGNVLHLYLDK